MATFGNTDVSGSLVDELGDATEEQSWLLVDKATLLQDSTLDSIHLSLEHSDSVGTETVTVRAVLYAVDSGGAGSHGLVASIERADVVLTANRQWFTFSGNNEPLVAGDYLIGAIGNWESTIAGKNIWLSRIDSNNTQTGTVVLTGAGAYDTLVAMDPLEEVLSAATSDLRGAYVTHTVNLPDPIRLGSTSVADIAAILGETSTKRSLQAVLAEHLSIIPETKYSAQEIMAGFAGIPAGRKSTQEMVFDNVAAVLALTGPFSKYSEQELWTLAYNGGMTLNQIIGNS